MYAYEVKHVKSSDHLIVILNIIEPYPGKIR